MFASALGVIASSVAIAATSASSEPIPSGCSADYSVPNQVTVTCEPGAGNGTHAFIRCRDLGGLPHTRIGAPIGPDGGVSQAVCATDETGPA
ncbi:hypothetical protein [Nocardia transvalensis]|uniref:hypothetical protein n=1 Tax=Nocardia transvalensis TaxID=37333 RepID=UPI0018932787|nr:hypothetical protein [Nocardia transvalensis]MBF6330897.1 hypothetical protein [Nocardia transvalensis]